MSSSDNLNHLSFLSGGGEMGAMLRSNDWSKTSVGDPKNWPSTLKNLIRLMLDNGSPMYISWGSDHTQFFNDPFRPLIKSEKLSHALTQTTKETFSDIWENTIRPMFERVINGESTSYNDFLLPHRTKDEDRESFYSFSLSPVRDESGLIAGIIVIATDTTKRVCGERQLKEERERLRLIADKVPAFISYMDSDGRYRFVNRAYSEWSEKPVSEIEGFSRKDFINDKATYDYLKPFEDKAFSGEKVLFDLVLKKRNGEKIFLDMEYLPDVDPMTGKVKGVIHLGVDVTTRKRVEESEERYRSLAETIPQMIWTCDPVGNLTYVNDRCLQFTGLSKERYNDSRDLLIHPHDDPHVKSAWKTCVQLKKSFKEEYRMRRVDGVYRWFLVSIQPIFDWNGNILYWNGTATDIDDHKKTERELALAKENAENANQTKTAFLANMSHEIRTPLGAILGFSELLKDVNLNSQMRDQYIETITRNGESLTKIIDDILDLAKVEAGRLEVEHIDFSLENLLFEVVELLSEKAKQKGIVVKLTFEENVPKNIYSDPTRLRQIFINIIGNAVKFTDIGGVDIRVKAQHFDDGTIQISVEVADTGRGLNEEQKNRLFVPFTQADNTTTRQFGGTGLGLALSKRLSEALGGTITIDRYEQGVGCTFVITFITMMGKSQLVRLPSVSEHFKSPVDKPLQGLNILFADDSADNQFLVEHFLMINGAEVSLANDGSEAVDKALAGSFNLVLMDIQMPKMDGHQATKILLSRGYKTPVIALTAHAMDEERERTKSTGFVGHLTKPLNFIELLETIIRLSK